MHEERRRKRDKERKRERAMYTYVIVLNVLEWNLKVVACIASVGNRPEIV